ncbi:MAG: hypothetical protein DMNBKLKJ_00177 [Candidatus Westeberhardia cardiocondylae]|nr:hypothetical protein [Candidatus Westeberhardia cardiocondylae]
MLCYVSKIVGLFSTMHIKNSIKNFFCFGKILKNSNSNGPPDLEDIVKNFLAKWKIRCCRKGIFNTKSVFFKRNNFYFFCFVVLCFFLFFIGNGFYTIKEAERGVVLRFGKFHHIVFPGLNWKCSFVDTVYTVNVESVQELVASGVMLTSDENVVHVEMNVQYRITNPRSYLFSVTNPDDSLKQATDSALRGVIGKYTMDRILTEGRTLVRNDTQRILEDIIFPYNMGITLLDVNFQTARPPEEVKESFDDAIAARENEQQFIREAEAYVNEVQPRANGRAQRILEEGRAYKVRTILNAKGEVERFLKILPEYRMSPEITKERLYIDVMEKVLSNTNKVLLPNNNTIFWGSGLCNHDFLNRTHDCLRETK